MPHNDKENGHTAKHNDQLISKEFIKENLVNMPRNDRENGLRTHNDQIVSDELVKDNLVIMRF